ncbi:hypothetical protein K1T71_002122 [Dendrolimus kikuchii]|uniref:Uncharacterized protein n=1 Tax=Dendrolimus kikuchii TaxID=765133 RepID=A0ACC1DFN4_9NEOP|nr:hypothetical protein K1T71_002122 [Dendrolimus kikuchii]
MNKVCRACLRTKESFCYVLFRNVSAEDYTFCTSVQVFENEDLPRALCNNCYELLITLSVFKKRCVASQNTLLGYKDNSKFENNFDEPELSQNSYEEKVTVIEDIKAVKTEDPLDEVIENNDIFVDDSPIEKIRNNQRGINKRKSKVKRITSKQKNSITKQKERRKVNHYTYKCEICHKKFGYLARFEAHKLTHEGKEMSIECNECKKTFSTWQSHKRHVINEHSVINMSCLRCTKCGKLCKSLDSVKMHEKRHETKSIHVCDVCGKGYNTAKSLKVHLEIHREGRQKECTCEHCGKKFYSKYLLNSHKMRVHANRFFICSICNYHFNEKHNLIKHIATHEGKKLYKCNICLKEFSSPSSIVIHRRTHSGERPYQCETCPKAFMSKKALADHTRIHTGERPFKCHVCDQSFNQQGTLWRHSRMHNRSVAVGNKIS